MEENSGGEKKPKFLGIFGVIRAAIEIPFIDPSFMSFTFITSLPLFCVRILPKLPFKSTRMSEALDQLEELSPLLYGTIGVASVLLPVLFTLVAAVTAIDSASIIYKGRAGRSMGPRALLRNSNIRKRWQNTISVYILMSWISSMSLEAVLLYGDSGPLRSLRNEWAPPLHFFTHVGVAFVRHEFSAWWQLALVVSVLEEENLVFDEFLTSSQLRKGNRFTGFALMLLSFGWNCLPHLSGLKRWSYTSGVAYDFIDTGCFCLGRVMNWAACTVYYHDCKNRQIRVEVVDKGD